MKICFLCDLHLPFDRNALQYDVLSWAIGNIQEEKPDCVAYAGDVTCDGNREVYKWFLEKMQGISIPFLWIPGNSDLRCPESRQEIQRLSSPCENVFGNVKIYAVNDCDLEISEKSLSLIEKADENSIVFMHHPISCLSAPSRDRMLAWRETHPDTFLFYGHLHETKWEGKDISLQALDPDKAIGECPCVTYFDTDTKEIHLVHYDVPVPEDIFGHLGVSCYDSIGHIEFCMEHSLKNLELRPNCILADPMALAARIEKWRQSGGENLCIHLPDVIYHGGKTETADIDRFIALANRLRADRFTQHVPCVSVGEVRSDPSVLENICDYLAGKFAAVDHKITVGVENMHMTPGESADDTRRFGYTPEECLAFMRLLGAKCKHPVGINFDIGHARNNAPFSQSYPISTWLSQVGKYAIGYHIHQVTLEDGKFNNHMPVTDVYGKLISFASFFQCWRLGMIQKAPIIFEMRPQGAYEMTLKTFRALKGDAPL